MGGRPWTAHERAFLTFHWGERDTSWIAESLGRTTNAIDSMAVRLGLGDRGAWAKRVTLSALARQTGWDYRTIKRAAAELGFKLHRAPDSRRTNTRYIRGRPYAITQEQAEGIVARLKEVGDYYRGRPTDWTHREPPHCAACGTVERRHRARGLCNSCYQHQWRMGKPRPKKPRGSNWDRHQPAYCRGCYSRERRHHGRGLCTRCFQQYQKALQASHQARQARKPATPTTTTPASVSPTKVAGATGLNAGAVSPR